MDMYWATVVYSQLKKREALEMAEDDQDAQDAQDAQDKITRLKDQSINHRCEKCGQNPYFCQCALITDSLKDKFNFEKSDY